MLLSKGFEVEIYTGTPQGDIVGLSDKIVAALPRFMREPDNRNVEYTTPPLFRYEQLLCELVRPRRILREYLQTVGNYTLIPGSSLSLGRTDQFYRSDPHNPYHGFIENTYGTKVVTASVHINVGIDNPDLLMRACRLIHLEAPLYLALSAASPFLGGEVTGYHSTRWHLFPQVPATAPLFENHAHFIRWTEQQLETGVFQNVRHFWSSVRPNGDRRPYTLNRLELRICELVSDPIALLAISAFLEARLWQLIENPHLDPLELSLLPAQTRADDLIALTDANESAVAHRSLEAELRHWQDGRTILARDWIEQLYEEVLPTAKRHGFSCFLSPLKKILREGNEAQRWLKSVDRGLDPRQVIQGAIASMSDQEAELEDKICQPWVA